MALVNVKVSKTACIGLGFGNVTGSSLEG